jgi:cytochrome c oxidase subunit 2
VIVAFVVLLLLYVMVRFRAGANPIPSKTAHNSLVEFVWTLLPVIILIGIAIPSFKLLYHADRAADAEMSIKAIGRQWYWSYEYPDAQCGLYLRQHHDCRKRSEARTKAVAGSGRTDWFFRSTPPFVC